MNQMNLRASTEHYNQWLPNSLFKSTWTFPKINHTLGYKTSLHKFQVKHAEYGLWFGQGPSKIYMLKALSPGRQHWEVVEFLGGGAYWKVLNVTWRRLWNLAHSSLLLLGWWVSGFHCHVLPARLLPCKRPKIMGHLSGNWNLQNLELKQTFASCK